MANNLDTLKKKIKELMNSLEGEKNWSKKALERAIIKNLSYPSFFLILGIDADKIEDAGERFIPRYETSPLLTIAREDYREVVRDLSLAPDEFADKVIKTLEKTTPSVIVPPYPSNNFVLAFVDKTFSTDLQKKYNEYSFFVHSYFVSWYIFPFSSVLEFKILKYELTTFLQVIKKVLEMYLNVYEA